MKLLTLAQVAETLAISESLARDMALAADHAAEVKAGTRALADVPPRLRPYLDIGFPMAKRIGRRLRRIDESAIRAWLGA